MKPKRDQIPGFEGTTAAFDSLIKSGEAIIKKRKGESNQKRPVLPPGTPTPIGMGALVSPADFWAEHDRREAHKAEEAAFESGGMEAVNKLRGKKK